jgi:hypothetical protein
MEYSFGVLMFGFFVAIFVLIAVFGFCRRNKQLQKMEKMMHMSNEVATGWTEGETTRLLPASDRLGVYNVRPRLLGKIETMTYQHLKRALPGHDILPHVRLDDIIEMTAQDTGDAPLRVFRRLSTAIVDFVVCDSDLVIIAVVDLNDQQLIEDERLTRLENAKHRSLTLAGLPHIRLDPLHLPSEEELRHQVLTPREVMIA